MKAEILNCAINIAQRHSRIKRSVNECAISYPDRNLFTIFLDLDVGNIPVLEQRYDDLIKEFEKRFNEDFDPLKGRNHGSCNGDMSASLTVTVDGIPYDEPEKPEPSRWYPFIIAMLPIDFVVGSIIVYSWLGNWDLAFSISGLFTLVLGWFVLRKYLNA